MKDKERILQAPQPYLFAGEMIKRSRQHMKPSSMSIWKTSSKYLEWFYKAERLHPLQGFHSRHEEPELSASLRRNPGEETPRAENNIDIVIGKGRIVVDDPENIIVNELINFPEIDYDAQSELVFAIGRWCCGEIRYLSGRRQLMNVVQYHKKEIARYIYSQMMEHFYCDAPVYEKPVVMPFTRIEEHNFAKYTKTASITTLRRLCDQCNSEQDIQRIQEACHNLYKFDSKTEKDFVIILEQDKAALRWLRPAAKQFRIYWTTTSNSIVLIL